MVQVIKVCHGMLELEQSHLFPTAQDSTPHICSAKGRCTTTEFNATLLGNVHSAMGVCMRLHIPCSTLLKQRYIITINHNIIHLSSILTMPHSNPWAIRLAAFASSGWSQQSFLDYSCSKAIIPGLLWRLRLHIPYLRIKLDMSWCSVSSKSSLLCTKRTMCSYSRIRRFTVFLGPSCHPSIHDWIYSFNSCIRCT